MSASAESNNVDLYFSEHKNDDIYEMSAPIQEPINHSI